MPSLYQAMGRAETEEIEKKQINSWAALHVARIEDAVRYMAELRELYRQQEPRYSNHRRATLAKIELSRPWSSLKEYDSTYDPDGIVRDERG